MFKTIKLKEDENKVFFVSDLHFNHDRDFVYLKRGFANVTEHNETLIKRWNETVSNDAIVFHLGDIIFNDQTGACFWNLLNQLNFKNLYLLWGNHTSGQRQAYLDCLEQQHPLAYNKKVNELRYEIYPLESFVFGNMLKRVIFLPQYAELSVNSDKLVLCHYPIISHNGQSHRSIHLCGHSHSGCEITNANTGKGIRLDVGIESFGRPVSLKEVKNHLKDRDTDSVDHH